MSALETASTALSRPDRRDRKGASLVSTPGGESKPRLFEVFGYASLSHKAK